MQTVIVELASDHPGFNDPEYRRRRDDIANAAVGHRRGEPPPRIQYTEVENATWAKVFRELVKLYPSHACREFLPVIKELQYQEHEIPQLAEVSAYLQRKTGFQLQPVAGLVGARDFLAALADRVFCSTQYIRHFSRPHYTPEPDIVHELMGHAPMLAIEDFAHLSQKIGQASLRATDDQIQQLASLYWYTIEYGLVRQDGQLRAYGAGLLSSFGELSTARKGEVQIRKLDPELAKNLPYPITSYQPVLWEVSSIREAFDLINVFASAEGLGQN